MKPFALWKPICCLLCFVLLAGCSKDDEPEPLLLPLVWPDDVAEAIPDSFFRAYCLERSDKDGDGRLSKEEALAVGKIDCLPDQSSMRTISSLEGLHYFANLETLYCGIRLLTSIDLSGNPRLRCLDCSFNSLGELDASGCSELEVLECTGCGLERLRLPRTAALTELRCENNRLASLDLTGCPALSRLHCMGNPFTTLDVHSNLEPRTLACSNSIGSTYPGI